ncbi:hydroxymethylbilane synthase [Sphingomonas sp. CGMCC 1.13654]|uniref:Porphobilinogen deaminase n=1 Tax=Sphingomonas chungangi TaxID=2683589 RepID=A0A838L0E6_9SPHN|nr:hydroxymethylbilane synthase [Sphingomonas chungangi]MBA2932517.1 hydroxymethylbilane synthase [Sphingomonas chungangi]MVW56140.1 hydroxymethylbilane synthase [Sphingomonas chungangi]
MTLTRPLRLGTRGSPLALVQANMVAAELRRAHGWNEQAIEIVPVKTTGDVVQDRPLAEIGGKALWTKELDRALLDGAIDFAVHSMKDVETIRPEAIRIAAMLPRADVRDRLIGAESIATLPHRARIGSSSPRRAAQLRHLRPDVSIVPFRGNVDTRLRKLAEGEADATLLAAAGLDRLARPDIGAPIPLDVMLPAPAQGAVGVEARAGDAATFALLAAIDHAETHGCVAAERAFLAALGADCHSPVAALATPDGNLRAELFSEDGALHITGHRPSAEAAELADCLLDQAPSAIRNLFAGR